MLTSSAAESSRCFEGRDFTRNEQGAPALNKDPGRVESLATTFQGLVNMPPVYSIRSARSM